MIHSVKRSGYSQPMLRIPYERNNTVSNANHSTCIVGGHSLIVNTMSRRVVKNNCPIFQRTVYRGVYSV